MPILFLLLLLAPHFAHASESSLEPNSPFLERLLSDLDPTAFTPAPFQVEDFFVEWAGEPLKGVIARLVPGSLQWVRVDEVLVVPRATLELSAEGIESGIFSSQGYSQPFALEGHSSRVRLLVPLASGERNALSLELKRAGKLEHGRLRLRFHPSSPMPRVIMDTSCSRTSLRVSEDKLPADSWIYIGCRNVRTDYEDSSHTELDLLIFADNMGPLRLNGAEAHPTDINRWNLRLNSSNRELRLEPERGGSLLLSAAVPLLNHRGHLGIGAGPYVLRFDKDATHFKSTVPLGTLYGAYSLPGGNRFVFFGAVTMNEHMYSDLGTYFQFESFRGIDRRVSLNLLIGVHGFMYRSPQANYARFNFPQGFEFFFFDCLQRGYNASLGGFLQPSINGREYYNTWLRWGPSSYFLELNYINTSEDPNFSITTYGLTLGVPLTSFL